MLSLFVFVMTLINAFSVAFLAYFGYSFSTFPNLLGAGIGICILCRIRQLSIRRYTDHEILALAA